MPHISGSSNPAHYGPWISTLNTRQPIITHWLAVGVRKDLETSSLPTADPLHGQSYMKFYKKAVSLTSKHAFLTSLTGHDGKASQLRGMGVEILDPRNGSLLDLVLEKCHSSRVITIDTALAHLCAASGIEADVLLCLFPDERWEELHQPKHNYGQFLKLRRSNHFGSWSAVLSSLTASLSFAG